MSNSFNIGDLVRLAQSLLDAKTNGREFMLEDVHNITRAAYEQYPEDPVINQVAFTIERMAQKAPSGATISQAEIANIYNNFVRLSSNSKFRETLGHLLPDEFKPINTQSPDYTKLNRVDAEDSKLDTDSFIDKNMVNAMSAAFSGSINGTKAYDNVVAEQGKEYVNEELKALGFKSLLEIMGGNTKNIVYAAHFDTRKGRVTVAIPTEISNGRVLFPSTFVADDKLEELTATKLDMFIEQRASTGNFSVPTAASILAAVDLISGHKKTASEKEFADIDKLFGEKDTTMALNTPGLFVDRQYEAGRPDINIKQEAEMPQELAHLARDFEDDVLEAASTFGLATIQKGKELIATELKTAGFKNAQVKFGSESHTSVVYLAQINTPRGAVEIEVPVEMQLVAENKYMPLAPTYFAYDGLIEDFTIPKLQRFAVTMPSPSTVTMSYPPAFTYMLLPELKGEIVRAASEGDYTTCEAALKEVQERYSEDDFRNAVSDYHFILMQKSRMAKQEQHNCSKMIPAGKGSIYPRCGHFGVPMNQVVVDAQGNCRLKTAIEREKLNPESEGGAAISTSKIFMS